MVLRLKEIRVLRGMTQQEVADALGCDVSTYNRYENGKREPSLRCMHDLAGIFQVSLDYMFGKDEVEESTMSDFEKEMIRTSRKLPMEVCEDMLDYMQVRAEREEKKAE